MNKRTEVKIGSSTPENDLLRFYYILDDAISYSIDKIQIRPIIAV